ncbi:MAG: hypothetical protein AABY22_07195 [Nanoarchaeota archaeon]
MIGFIGNYPEQFNSLFKIDYETQFRVTFLEKIQILFDAVGWGKCDLDETEDSFSF